MRVKRRPDKGEMFRKSLCCTQCSDSEVDSDDSDHSKNLMVTAKSERREAKEKEIAKKGRKEAVSDENENKGKDLSIKKDIKDSCLHKKANSEVKETNPLTRKHKHSRSKENLNDHDREQASKYTRKTKETNFAIISQNRITRRLGIYNKAKKSDTILRESMKQKLCKKKFDNVKSRTAKNLARVLDCSSFKILPSSSNAVLRKEQDSPSRDNQVLETSHLGISSAGSNKTHSSLGSAGSCSQFDAHRKRKTTPQQKLTPQRTTPQNEGMLAFKTPLQQISQVLTDSLNPLETFNGKDYFAEVQGQLCKMYKQSSISSSAQKKFKSIEVASEVQRCCLKRKSLENATENEIRKTESPVHCQDHLYSGKWIGHDHRESEPHITKSNTESASGIKGQNNLQQTVTNGTYVLASHLQTSAFPAIQESCSSIERTIEDRCTRKVQRRLFGPNNPHFMYNKGQDTGPVQRSSSFDILDFLDGFDHQPHFQETKVPCKEYVTPEMPQVSPPKKPTLESSTPDKRFYPRKLY